MVVVVEAEAANSSAVLEMVDSLDKLCFGTVLVSSFSSTSGGGGGFLVDLR